MKILIWIKWMNKITSAMNNVLNSTSHSFLFKFEWHNLTLILKCLRLTGLKPFSVFHMMSQAFNVSLKLVAAVKGKKETHTARFLWEVWGHYATQATILLQYPRQHFQITPSTFKWLRLYKRESHFALEIKLPLRSRLASFHFQPSVFHWAVFFSH